MKKETDMSDSTFDIDTIDLEDLGVLDLLNILKTHGRDAFEQVFTQWHDGDYMRHGDLYDLVMTLVHPGYL